MNWTIFHISQPSSKEVDLNLNPNTASEDFAYFLQECPGCYVFLGNGSNAHRRIKHSTYYDFNDESTPFGAAFFSNLVERQLPLDRP